MLFDSNLYGSIISFMNVINLQLQIFILVGIGYFLSKKKIISTETRKQIVTLILTIIYPCNIIHSFQMEFNIQILKDAFMVVLLACLLQVLMSVLNLFLYKGFDERKQDCMKYGTICSNAGFIGMPVAQAFFGAKGLLFMSVALIPQRIVMWSSGVEIFSKQKGKGIFKKVMTHPCIASVWIGLILMILQVKLPPFLDNTLTGLSNCTTSMSMMCVGMILGEVPASKVIDKTSLYYTCIRLIGIPLLVFGLLYFVPVDPVVKGLMVLVGGMPCGTTTAMVAGQYGGDDLFASQIIFTSTLFSLITIPLLSILL